MACAPQKGAVIGEALTHTFEIKEEVLDEIDSPLAYVPVVYTTRLDDMNIFKKDITHLPSSTVLNYIITESRPKVPKRIYTFERKKRFHNLKFMRLLYKLKQYNNDVRTDISNKTIKVKIEPEHEADDFENNNDVRMDMSSKTNKVKIELEREEAYFENSTTQTLIQLTKPLCVTLINCASILKFRYCIEHTNTSNNEAMKCKECVKFYNINDNSQFKKRNYVPKAYITRLMCINKFLNSIKSGSSFLTNKIKKTTWKLNAVCVVMHNLSLNNTEIYHFSLDLRMTTDYSYVNHAITTDEELSKYVKNHDIIEIFNCCSLKRYTYINYLLASLSTKPSRFFFPKLLSRLNSDETCKKCNPQTVSSSSIDPSLGISSKCNNVNIPSDSIKRLWQSYTTSTDSNNVNGIINKALHYARNENLKSQPEIRTARVAKLETPRFALEFRHDFYTQYCILRNGGEVQSYLKAKRNYKSEKSLLKSKYNLEIQRKNICCWLNHQDILNLYPSPVTDLLESNIHNCQTGNCKCCCNSKIMVSPLNFKEIKLAETFNHTERYTTRLKEMYEINVKIDQKTKSKSEPIANINNPKVSMVQEVPKPNQKFMKSKAQQHPVVCELFISILQRFQNIKLSLSAERKVQAILDAPATSFSNLELKILSQILGHAQEHVNNMGNINNYNSNLSDRRFTSELDFYSKIPSSDAVLHRTSNSNNYKQELIKDEETNSNNNLNLENTETMSTALYNIYGNLTILQNEQISRSFESFFSNKLNFNNSPLAPVTNASNETVLPCITEVFSLNPEVGTQDDSTKVKPKGKRSSETISQLGNFLPEKKTKLDIPSTSCQEYYTSGKTPDLALQQKSYSNTLMVASNLTMALTNELDYHNILLPHGKPVPDTLVHPNLIPCVIGNTDLVDSSIPQNQPLLPIVASPVVEPTSSEILQSHILHHHLQNTTIENNVDEECILGV